MRTSFFPILRSVYFFKDLSDADITFIGDYCHFESYSANHVLFRERDAADKFYVVQSGKVEIWKNYETNEALLLAVEGPGHIFGEMALVDDLDRSATIVTHETSEFLVFSHADFEEIMLARPKVSLSILRSLSLMLRTNNDLFIQNLSQQNKQLQKAYLELKTAQEDLIRTERFSNLGKFSSFIIHDLRNPIAMIRGFGEMIKFECETPACIDFSTKIIQEADRVHRVANEILDYSRGEIRLNYVLTTAHNVLAKIEPYINDSFQKKNVGIRFDNTSELTFLIDEERVLRVLINIADNARKACSSGSEVVFSARDLKNSVEISVKDNGVGMKDEVKAKVFEPFFSSASNGGTGLGMVIVKNVVEAHGGTIFIESEHLKGTEVRIVLPLGPPES